jgi:hypothetical protein
MSTIPNDEPIYDDYLEHRPIIKQLGSRILACKSPYVIGVCGSWGSGKTSFLRKLWAYLGGAFEAAISDDIGAGNEEQRQKQARDEKLREWFGDEHAQFLKGLSSWQMIWFNPWQHQFESSPLNALLQEIRQHFSLKRKTLHEASKLGDIAFHTTLNTLAEWGKAIKLPIPNAKAAVERGREYEAERFSAPLTSQRFRDFFEEAIEILTGKDGRLVIFIDDLDRCEGEVAYRLLESLKLYLNARNCTYVLGLDQKQLEEAIAKVLSGQEETSRYRPLSRDYLSKMFQGLFLLPVPASVETYIDHLLNRADASFAQRLTTLFDWKNAQWGELIGALDRNLPHNPRKMKAFISAWKLHIELLPTPTQGESFLNWRLTLILNYLAQFEEPLFRKVEEAPGFYSDRIVKFCRTWQDNHPLFEGLERPYGPGDASTGGFDDTTPGSTTDGEPSGGDKGKPSPPVLRTFWISRLIRELSAIEGAAIPEETIRRHLLTTGGKLPSPPQAPQAENA